MRAILVAAVLLSAGCAAAQKPKAAVPSQPVIEPVPSHPGYHLGPEYWHCDAENNCELVRNWLDANNKPVLSPLGCLLGRARITWIFGDRASMCEKH